MTKGIVGAVKKDKKMLKIASADLCWVLDIPRAIGSIVAEIALDKYNPDKTGLNEGTF